MRHQDRVDRIVPTIWEHSSPPSSTSCSSSVSLATGWSWSSSIGEWASKNEYKCLHGPHLNGPTIINHLVSQLHNNLWIILLSYSLPWFGNTLVVAIASVKILTLRRQNGQSSSTTGFSSRPFWGCGGFDWGCLQVVRRKTQWDEVMLGASYSCTHRERDPVGIQ